MAGAKDLRIGFIGAGRAAATLAPALQASGYGVRGISSRSPASAEALASRLADCEAFPDAQGLVEACDLVFLTVPDDAIRNVAAALRWPKGIAVVHCCGVESREALASAAAQGATTAALHPLQSFASAELVSLKGAVFAVEAEDDLRETLLKLVEDLGGTPLELSPSGRSLYHASAVLASNYVVTLTKMASDLWLKLGLERDDAVRALLPLLKGAVDNLERQGVPGALTGPVARGDIATVQLHLTALEEAAPELLPAYRELALQTLPIARTQGGLSIAAATALRQVLMSDTACEGRAAHRP